MPGLEVRLKRQGGPADPPPAVFLAVALVIVTLRR
jgi:hypothetical protein